MLIGFSSINLKADVYEIEVRIQNFEFWAFRIGRCYQQAEKKNKLFSLKKRLTIQKY